jgi:hypothetical protein
MTGDLKTKAGKFLMFRSIFSVLLILLASLVATASDCGISRGAKDDCAGRLLEMSEDFKGDFPAAAFRLDRK